MDRTTAPGTGFIGQPQGKGPAPFDDVVVYPAAEQSGLHD